jgi:hypothetical protein
MGSRVGISVDVAVGSGVAVGRVVFVGKTVGETGFRLGVGLEAGERNGNLPLKANSPTVASRIIIPIASQPVERPREEARIPGRSTKVADGFKRRSSPKAT